MARREKSKRHHGERKKKDEDLFVFGYASKLFRDDKIAGYHEEARHLIPWPGDDSLLIDRYDCRLLFTEKSQFESKAGSLSYGLSPEEQEMERLCDEERYLELHTNLEEQDIEQEEEMKRFKEALSQDGAYSSVGFTYNNTEQESTAENLQSSSDHNLPQGPAPYQAVEQFVAPEELEVPDGMEIPDTAKMNAIIEKSALFVSEHGAQMEILVKAKQAGNPQFDFLNFDNWLNPYYKHMLKYIRDGKYEPQVNQTASPKQEQEPEPESEEEDSDGEFELHPLLTASHRSASCTPNSSAPSSPVPVTNTGDQYNYPSTIEAGQVSYSVDVGTSSRGIPGSFAEYTSDGTDMQRVDYSTVWAQHNQVAAGYHYAASGSSSHLVTSTPVMTAADLLPPPPPPPGEGPLEGEWQGADANHSHHVQPHAHYPTQNNVHLSAMPHGTTQLMPGHPAVMTPSAALAPILPPSPDIQPIIDKLASYVVKNGPEFENIIKTKNDPRFAFVHPWNENHQYYLYKKQLCYEQAERERREAAAAAVVKQSTASPISFSIKPKEVSKPKIEYRTNVIYKQSCEPGESEDEENKDSDGSSNGNESEKMESSETELKTEEVPENTESPSADLEIQMTSIEAAEKEARRLESESQSQREKQLQIERKRRASLFISMLKKTRAAEEQNKPSESDKQSIQGNGSQKRRFTENKRASDTKIDMFEEKKTKYESAASSGVGAPSPAIIRATQDLMAKVRAASRTNR